MADALRRQAERQLREIVLVQEGLDQLRAGQGIPIEDVIADFVQRGILDSADLGPDVERTAA